MDDIIDNLRCDSKLLPIAMIKNIKEPFLTLPIAKCNTIPANLQQIKELYEDNNYDSSQHNNVIEILPIHGGSDHITNTHKQHVQNSEEGKLLQKNSSHNMELLEYCTTTANSIPSYCTITTYNEIVQEHGKYGTIHNCDAVINGELDVSCNHTSINEALHTSNVTDTSNETMVAIVPTDLPLSLSPEQTSENDNKQFGMEILQFINILLCMLTRHLMCKDMFAISPWPNTREITVPLYDSPCVNEQHEIQKLTINHCMPSLTVNSVAVFLILCWLSLKWRRIFLLLMMFYSTTKSLIVNILNATANFYQSLTCIKYFKSFDNIRHWCDSMCCTCLGLTRLYRISTKPLPRNMNEVAHSTAYNDSLCAAAVVDDDDNEEEEVLICREETGHDQNYQAQEDVLHLSETCEHDSIHNEGGTELVIGTTGCIWSKGKYYIITASHDALDMGCPYGSDDDIPLSIPANDNNDHEVVSVSVCTEPAVLELHYQLAECRNADHAFVQDEKNSVNGNLFSFSSPLNSTHVTNISFEIFRRSHYIDETHDTVNDTDPHVNTEIDVIEVTPFQEETNQSNHSKRDTDKVKNHMEDQPENAKGSERDDDKDDHDDHDDDDSDDDDCTEECVEECQPCACDATSDELVGASRFSDTSYDGVQCCSDDSGELLIGIYTINNKAYDAHVHSILFVNGQVLYVHAYNDAVRPIGGGHVSKPTANNNQPPVFEYTAYNASRLTVNQQDASLTASAAARTEHSKHQLITSTDDTFVEKDGRLRDDALTTPEEQSITTESAAAYPYQQDRNAPHYNDAKLREDAPLSYEEVKQNSKAKTTFQQHEVEDRSQQVLKQNIAHQNVAASNATGSKPKSLPKRSCMVVGNTQYPLAPYLLAHPHMDHFFVKERREIKPGHFLAKLVLQHHYLIMQNNNAEVNETATAAQQSQAAAIVADTVAEERDGAVTKRQHYAMNVNRTGYIAFSSDLTRFTGDIKYPVPGRKATAVKLGKGGNGFVFSIFHNGKEYAVKKTVYRPNEIRVHSQLAHVNLVNLEAVLIGEEHDHHKGKFYAFYFMNKLDMDFRSVISTKEHGCLKHLKLQLSEQRNVWEVVMVNVKYVLRSVLKALEYMHNQGLVHRDVKASNILLKMNCQCTKPLMCACPKKYSVKLGDFDSSTIVPGHGLNIEPHQLIRYASVLPLGTMGYRAPEVSMHLVISGPYEVLYTTAVDIWSFGCLLLNILIGKCGPLKQRGEASLLLSVQDQPYCEDLYNKIIKMKELQKYYSDIPEMIDLVRKCLQVKVHCRPTAQQLLQLDILQ